MMSTPSIAAKFLTIIITVASTIFCLSAGAIEPAQSSRPNIVVILADDLGAEALGCYGGAEFLGERGKVLGPVKTPHLDAMAANGIRFAKAYATPVCSPSRAQLLTGKYNYRVGFHDILGRNGAARELDSKTHPTIANLLKSAGYMTGTVGKWHIGPLANLKNVQTNADADTNCPHVLACGFERQFMVPGAHLREYGEPIEGKYTPDIMDAWAFRFMSEAKTMGKPFFLYYASPLPHFPYWPTPLNPDGPRGEPGNKKEEMHGDMANFPFLVEYLDKEVGKILAKLEELGMRENTLVLFAGDNGTPNWLVTQMKDGRKIPFGKATMKEAGSWVPLIASWPAMIRSGSVYDGLVDFSDILPTCLSVAGVPLPNDIDGISFAPVLEGKGKSPREWVHSLYNKQWFVQNAGWKLRENGELYDMSNAPYDEKLVAPDKDTPNSQAARESLQSVADKLHPPQN
jgi:arylsulfatase A